MLEIAGGIIIAVAFFWVLPLIFAGGILLVAVLIAVGIAVLIYTNQTAFAEGLSWFAAVALSVALPVAAYKFLFNKSPIFRAIIDGNPPFVGLPMGTLRVLLTGGIAIGLTVLGYMMLVLFGAYLDAYWK